MSRIEQPENQNTETGEVLEDKNRLSEALIKFMPEKLVDHFRVGHQEPPAFKEPPDSTLFMFKPDGSLSPDNRFLSFDHGGAASGARSDVEPTPLPDAEQAF